jgi:signal transduction histidine kinase
MTSPRSKTTKRKRRTLPSSARRSSATGLHAEIARLTRELDEALARQEATSEVLRVISSTPGELEPVFQSMLANATRICEAKIGILFRYENGAYSAFATLGVTPAYAEYLNRGPIQPGPTTGLGRLASTRQTIHIVDAQSEEAYAEREPFRVATAELGGARSLLNVPMLKEGELIGAIGIFRQEVRPFTDKQIALVTNFASQAVIAIENVRLFDEIQDKSRQLAQASQHKTQFLSNMSHELRTPLNAILGYTELIIDNIYGDTPPRMRDALQRIETNGKHLLGLVNDVLDLSKIEAGQFTLALADYSLTNVVQAVYSAIEPLAAEKKLGFRVELPARLPPGHGDERRLTQVLLNLVGNAIKFTDSGEVVIEATSDNRQFSVAVRDTGPGISQTDQARLFQEFQQADNSITKQKAGTGLGLVISKRIIEMHGGNIRLDSVVGQGSSFSFTLPVTVNQQARPA